MTGPGYGTYMPVTAPGLEAVDEATRDRARRVIAANATDAADARDLLGMTGLLAECAERAAVVRGDGA